MITEEERIEDAESGSGARRYFDGVAM